MRYEPTHKEKTRKNIVETASREFRAHGFEGVGIAQIMQTLRLTHGGFYAHFKDKDQLVAESSVHALEESLTRMLEGLAEGGFPMLLEAYLSEDNRDHPEAGCPLPALSADVARAEPGPRAAFTAKLGDVFQQISGHMPGATAARREEKVLVLFATLCGAVSLARAVSNPAMSARLLAGTKQHLLSFVAGD